MKKTRVRGLAAAIGLLAFILIAFLWIGGRRAAVAEAPPAAGAPTPVLAAPPVTPFADSPLRDSVVAAGDFIVRQQLSNGELAYQVDVLTEARDFSPSAIRLIAGTGSLFTVCRVSGERRYCAAGDAALDHYLKDLIVDPRHFPGACFYTNGTCQLGGSALAIDAIYKRWLAGAGTDLGGRDLAAVARDLGYFIVSMRKPDGGFYHAFDPHFAGTVDPDAFVIYFPGESLLALLELYEMTGNEFWLTQARQVHEHMTAQPVTEDHWHSYAFSMFARLDRLPRQDLEYARQIADKVIAGQVRSLDPRNTSIATATKIESLAALALAFRLSGAEHEWLDQEIRTFITFVRARQVPDNNCNWTFDDEQIEKFGGGILSSCEEPSVRVDGVQHYVNGVTTYLEYRNAAGPDDPNP